MWTEPTPSYPWRQLLVDVPLLLLLVERTVQPGNQYLLGGKAPDLDMEAAALRSIRIDCSGYVRWLLRRSTGELRPNGTRTGGVVLPDGSWNQGEWAAARLKPSTVDSAKLEDDALRLVQLPSLGRGVGHVALVHNGWTMESSGKRGPVRRVWDGAGWQSRCRVWVVRL